MADPVSTATNAAKSVGSFAWGAAKTVLPLAAIFAVVGAATLAAPVVVSGVGSLASLSVSGLQVTAAKTASLMGSAAGAIPTAAVT